MKNNIKGYLITTFLLFVTGSLMISSTIINLYKTSIFVLLIISSIIFIIYLLIFKIHSLNIKDLIKNKVFCFFTILYFSTSIIHSLYSFYLLIDNYYYIITPTLIIFYFLLLFTIIMSCNNQTVNLNIFFVISTIFMIALIIISILFPKGDLKIDFKKFDVEFHLYSSYFILLMDAIYYNLLFKAKGFQLTKKSQILSLITAITLIFIYSFIDLSIVPANFLNTFFPNLLKYKISKNAAHIHLDIICLILMLIIYFFRVCVFGDGIRIFYKKSKKSSFLAIVFTILFAIATFLCYIIPNDFIFTKYLIIINGNLAFIILLILGGIRIVKTIHRKKQKQN